MDFEALHKSQTLQSANTCRGFLNRMYFSRHLQLVYLILIGFCLFDLILTVSTWHNYPSNTWTIILDLVLNLIVILDSLLRLYTMGLSRFCTCRSNWIEILVLLLAVPEVLFLIVFLSVRSNLSQNLELTMLIYSGVIIILRPIVLCKRQTRAKVPSIHLPSTVIVDEAEQDLIREATRFDSVLEDSAAFNTKKSVNS